MKELKAGDFIGIKYSVTHQEFGVIVYIGKQYMKVIRISKHSMTFETIHKTQIEKLSKEFVDTSIKNITTHYDNEIVKLESSLKSVKPKDYQGFIDNKYSDIKKQIFNTCENLLATTNDADFEEKLKAICVKKKNIFSIENEDAKDARKYNGEVLYKIKEAEKTKNESIRRLNNNYEYMLKNTGL